VLGGIVATIVMLVAGFFFATVSVVSSGSSVSSNNPISGLTLSTVIVAALLMVRLASPALPVWWRSWVSLPWSAYRPAVAGELLQDFKVGYISEAQPRTIQIVELVAVIISALVMYFPLLVLHVGYIKAGGIGFGDRQLPAPQAGLMASISQESSAATCLAAGCHRHGFGRSADHGAGEESHAVRGRHVSAVPHYLCNLRRRYDEVGDGAASRSGNYNEAQRARMENIGVLCASA
jgi:hypothetical protein